MKAEIGKTYQHYKNHKLYKILNFATHTETGETMVVYEAQYDTPDLGPKPIFVRPQAMFEEKVEFNGTTIDRFLAV